MAQREIVLSEDAPVVLDLSDDELERRIAWRDGIIALHDDTLADAVAEVERYAHVRFVFEDEELRALKVGGYLRAGDVTAFSALLQSNLGVDSQQRGDEIVLRRHADATP